MRFALVLLFLLLVALPSTRADFGEAQALTTTWPGDGVSVEVPSTVAARYVMWNVQLRSSASASASARISIESPCGAASAVVARASQDTGNTFLNTHFLGALVRGGDCYYTTLSPPGGTGSATSYSYAAVDILKESFESRQHANATWCERGTNTDTACVGNRYANDTQTARDAHRNATYCLRSTATAPAPTSANTCVTTGYANSTNGYCGPSSATTYCDTSAQQLARDAYANGTYATISYTQSNYCRTGSDPDTTCVGNRWLNTTLSTLETSSHAAATYETQERAVASRAQINTSLTAYCLKGTEPDAACVGNRHANDTQTARDAYTNATYEAQARAIATRAEMNASTQSTYCQKGTDPDTACVSNRYANATYEGQLHANQTWCPTVNCVTTIDGQAFVTNTWANGTAGFCRKGTDPDTACVGNRYSNATHEGRDHANMTWCPAASCMTTASAMNTFEGQLHANATWETAAHALSTFCSKGSSCANLPENLVVGNLTVLGHTTTDTFSMSPGDLEVLAQRVEVLTPTTPEHGVVLALGGAFFVASIAHQRRRAHDAVGYFMAGLLLIVAYARVSGLA